MFKYLLTILCLPLLLGMENDLSLYSNKNAPIEITADSLRVEREKQLVEYIGNVIIQQANTTIMGDRVKVYFSEQKQEIQKIFIEGTPATLEQIVAEENSNRYASGKTIIYSLISMEISVIGNAFMRYNNLSLQGGTIKYNAQTGDVSADLGKDTAKQPARVRTTIVPEEPVPTDVR